MNPKSQGAQPAQAHSAQPARAQPAQPKSPRAQAAQLSKALRLAVAVRRAAGSPLTRWRDLASRGQSGQAVVESGILLATLIGALAVGGVALNKTHPEMLNAINLYMRGFYFTLSLPFP